MYGTLSTSEDRDIFPVSLKKNEALHARFAVPDSELSSVRQPRLVFVGPGLSQLPHGLPFSIPHGDGIILSEEKKIPSVFSNPFSFRSWKEIETLTFEAPADGTYFLTVYDAVKEQGSYGIFLQGTEPASPLDVFRTVLNGTKVLVNF